MLIEFVTKFPIRFVKPVQVEWEIPNFIMMMAETPRRSSEKLASLRRVVDAALLVGERLTQH